MVSLNVFFHFIYFFYFFICLIWFLDLVSNCIENIYKIHLCFHFVKKIKPHEMKTYFQFVYRFTLVLLWIVWMRLLKNNLCFIFITPATVHIRDRLKTKSFLRIYQSMKIWWLYFFQCYSILICCIRARHNVVFHLYY